VVANSLGQTRFVTTILVLFSASALLLAGVGVFSVVSYSIGRRVRELAIRMAFGATKESILALVVRQALVPAAIGVALGLATALAVSRLLSNQLYGVVAHDLPTYVAAAFLILAMAALSTWLPAWRATRVDPNSVLHSE
jgi:putative ABC transport system permease protein